METFYFKAKEDGVERKEDKRESKEKNHGWTQGGPDRSTKSNQTSLRRDPLREQSKEDWLHSLEKNKVFKSMPKVAGTGQKSRFIDYFNNVWKITSHYYV